MIQGKNRPTLWCLIEEGLGIVGVGGSWINRKNLISDCRGWGVGWGGG